MIYNEIVDTFNNVKDTATKFNKSAQSLKDEMYTEAIEMSKEWKALGNKAYKGGSKIAGKQHKINMKAFTEVKNQLTETTKRFKQIVNL